MTNLNSTHPPVYTDADIAAARRHVLGFFAARGEKPTGWPEWLMLDCIVRDIQKAERTGNPKDSQFYQRIFYFVDDEKTPVERRTPEIVKPRAFSPNTWSGRFINGGRVREAYQYLLRAEYHIQTGKDAQGAALFRSRPPYLQQQARMERMTLEQPEQGRFTQHFRKHHPHCVDLDTDLRKAKRKSPCSNQQQGL